MKTATHEVKSPLPDFKDPPVVEVALSVQFEPLSSLSTSDLAVYWNDILRREYKWKEASPIPTTLEWFGLPQPKLPTSFEFSVQPLETPPPHRALFFSKDETALIQLQRDRFVRNWRKANQTPYCRYESIRASFREQFESFCSFVAKSSLGACVPNQCEVTYVNHIPWGREGQPREDLSEVLSAWANANSGPALNTPESVDVTARYPIMDSAGTTPVGRLHVAANHAYRTDDLQPILALTLTARGRPASEGLDDVMAFLDRAREHVARGFAAMTTTTMHQRWGRRA